ERLLKRVVGVGGGPRTQLADDLIPIELGLGHSFLVSRGGWAARGRLSRSGGLLDELAERALAAGCAASDLMGGVHIRRNFCEISRAARLGDAPNRPMI